MTAQQHATEGGGSINDAWMMGYSIAELWGFGKPVRLPEPENATHVMLWGILSIVEYQCKKGAGHQYLRDRLWKGDWIAIGFREPKTENAQLVILPPIKNPKFGRNRSEIGSSDEKYSNTRVVHAKLLANYLPSRCIRP